MNNDPKPPADQANPVVVFHLSDDRRKEKKQAAKDRRNLIRDRLREPTKIAR